VKKVGVPESPCIILLISGAKREFQVTKENCILSSSSSFDHLY